MTHAATMSALRRSVLSLCVVSLLLGVSWAAASYSRAHGGANTPAFVRGTLALSTRPLLGRHRRV